MQKKERVIDLRQYFQSLIEHAVIIVIVCCLFAAGMAAYSYKKQVNQTSTEVATIDAIITQNREAYYSLSNSGTGVYTDADAPKGTYTSYARLYVDFNYEDMEISTGADFDKVSTYLQKDACMLVWNDDNLNAIIDELKLKEEEDLSNITAEKLTWMINRNFQGSHVMNIAVTDVDPNRAHDICEAVVNKFIPTLKDYMNVDEVRIVNEASYPDGSGSTAASDEVHISNKKLVKYGIVGFAGGFIFMAIVLLFWFIIADCVRNELDIEYAGFKKYGKTLDKKDTAAGYKGLAYKLAAEADVKSILIADLDGKFDTESMTAKMSEALKEKEIDLQIASTEDLKNNAELLYLAKDYDAFLLTASYAKSRMKDLEEAYSQLGNSVNHILGLVLVK
jgi:capsular polysaccharide biosynthesis protein